MADAAVRCAADGPHADHPRAPSLFVGRERERARLRARLPSVSPVVVCGVAGVGKTALGLVIAADWHGPVVFCRLARDTSPGELYDDVRRQLGAPVAGGGDREAALVDALDDHGALWLVDDLHVLAPDDQRAVLEVAALLSRARLLATSRELVRRGPGDGDILQLRLDGLTEPEGRALWAHLDELYGPVGSYERAWARSKGNPFLLRQAHVAPLDDEQPLEATWQVLSSDERHLAAALAVAQVRLPIETIRGVLPGDRGRAALRGLAERLVVEIDIDRGCALHELFRAVALAHLDATGRAALCGVVAGELRHSALELVARACEVSRLVRAAGDPDAAGAYLLSLSAELIRRGAAGELLAGLDAIPVTDRTLDVQVARVRARARRLELRGAGDDLEQLRDADGPARVELALARGQVAVLLGRAADAERDLSAVASDPGAPAALRSRGLAALGVLRCYQGRGDDARTGLDAGERWAEDAATRAQLAIARAVTFWIDERPREAAACVRRALELIADREPGFRVTVVARSVLAGAIAQLGELDDASNLLQLAEASLRADSDPRARGDLRGIAATIAFAAGRRAEARAELEAVLRVFERQGYLPGVGWTYAWLGRVLLSLGRRRAGLARLAEARAVAAATGLQAIAQTAERSLAEDVLSPAWLARHDADDAARPAERMRAHLAAAIRAAAAGDARRTRHWLARATAPADDDDHGLDRALAELAGAVLARASGDRHAADLAIAAAAEIAASAGADPDLVPALFAMVERVRIGGEAREGSAGERAEAPARELVVDTHEHVLHAGGRAIALGKHPLLRAALYTFAAAPAHTLGKDALVRAIWGAPYDPLVHDHALKANMHRLRRLLDGTGLRLVNDAGAYRLEVSGRLLVIGSS